MSTRAGLVIVVGLLGCVVLISATPAGFARTLCGFVLGLATWMVADLVEKRARP